MRALPCLRFRFTDPADTAQYGGDWTVYDESKVIRLPLGELAEIEEAIDMSVVQMFDRFRTEAVTATVAAMWVARRMAGQVGPFDAFTPLVLLAEWEHVPQPEAEEAPLEPASCEETASPT